MTDDEAQVVAIWKGLHGLARQTDSRVWSKNIAVFQMMDTGRRLWWWAHVQKQAALGVPAMEMLVAEVIKQRLIG